MTKSNYLHILRVFAEHGLPAGGHLFLSKSECFAQYPAHTFIFDAEISMSDGKDSYFWCGDLDLTIDFVKLEGIAKELDMTLTIHNEQGLILKIIDPQELTLFKEN